MVARSDTFAPLLAARAPRALARAGAVGPAGAAASIDVDGRPHHLVVVPAEAGGTVFGFVAAAAPVDDRWATALRDAERQGDRRCSAPAGIAGTTLAPGPRAVANAGRPIRPAAPRTLDVDLGGERFESVGVADPHAPALMVVALQSLDLALAPYRNIQLGLVLLGLRGRRRRASAAGALLARSITAPIGGAVGGHRDGRARAAST